jgi:MFS family permease
MNFKVLRNKNFSLLMLGKAVSMMGSNMQQFALSLYVLAITGSATIFASMMAISILPRLLLSPVAGVFGDWFDRKKSIVTLDFINGLLIGSFAIYYGINGELSLISIYLLVILLEVTEIFFGSAMTAVVPSIVDKEELFQANSIKSVVASVCSIASPLLASVLYAFMGLQVIFIVNSISFILSALSEMSIHIPATHKKPEKINLKAFKTDLVEGMKIIKNDKMIMNIIGIGMIINFCLSPLFNVGLIFIIRETLKGSEMQYGLFATVISLAMLLSPITLGGLAQRIKVGRLTVYVFGWTAALVGLLALVSTNLFIGLYTTNTVPFMAITLISFLIGMVITLANIAVGTLFGTIVPKEFMGRTGAVLNLGLTVAMPLGQMISGVALDILPASYVIAATAVIITLAILYYRKSLLEADNPSQDTVQGGIIKEELVS